MLTISYLQKQQSPQVLPKKRHLKKIFLDLFPIEMDVKIFFKQT